MSEVIIKVENLFKRYRIGIQEKKADTFVQQLWNNIKAPVENFKRIKGLGRFQEEDESVHWAIKDVSFEVKKGEVFGIIGKNGAGKSTLLKILSKITEPTSGRIEMKGRVAALLEVGTGFHPELTGRENIYMNGTILGMTKKEIDRKLDEIIDFSGVEKYIDTPVKFYSSGMRVRLGFSVAAHLEPEILIIDEVLAVGDYEFQQKCLGKMENVSHEEGRTVLFVSHNMEAVRNLCRYSILLNNGKIEINDHTSEVLRHYLKGKLTSNYLNIFEAGLEGMGNKNIQLEEIIISSNSSLSTEFVTGESLCIKLSFRLNSDIDFSKARIDVRIDNQYNQRLIWMSSIKKTNFEFQNGEIVFSINNNPLLPGDYLLTVFIYDGVDVSDWFPGVLTFSISSTGELYKNFKIPNDQSNIYYPFEIL